MPSDTNEQDCNYPAQKMDTQRSPRRFFRAGSQARYIFEELEIIADRIRIAAGLVDLSQRERAFMRHPRKGVHTGTL